MEQLPLLPRVLFLVHRAAGRWFAAWVVLLVLQGVVPVAIVYLSRNVINGLVIFMRSGGQWDASGQGVRSAILLALLMLAGEVLRNVTSYVRTVQSDLFRDSIVGMIQEKSASVDLEFYDSPEFFDHLHRAKDEAVYRPVQLIETLGTLVQNAITLVAMAGVLLSYGAGLPIALLLATLPAFYVVIRYSLLEHNWRRQVTPDERRSWYYDWLLTMAEPAAEMRLFALGNFFREAYRELRAKLRGEHQTLARQRAVAESTAGMIAVTVAGAAILWKVWRMLRASAGTLGDLVLFYQAFQQGLLLTRSLLSNAGQLYGNILFLGNMFEFLDLQPLIREVDLPANIAPTLKRGILFEDVTFHYPGSQRVALQQLRISFEANRMTALVGSNGAGKSTLVRLLARFYDPQEGRIVMDGIDLRNFRREELRQKIAILFQQPVHFNTTVRQNVELGDLRTELSARAIMDATRESGAQEVVDRLPHGLETMLGRAYREDGAELSVGEWQRVALARSLVRGSEVLVLDEPTSAMDPWAEMDWLERFRRLAAGRTVILVTHRFTTAMCADVIHVMDGGRVIESGSHAELLEKHGRYAAAWRNRRADEHAGV